MDTADLLLNLMFSWIDQRERCARQLKKLADELESLRKKCNAGECFGNSASVVGAACLLGAGAATLFTGGAAAPFLGLLGGVYTGVGVTVSVVTKLTEHFVSSDTMKEAEKIEKESNNIARRIQKQFDQLKAEIKKASPCADLDEVDGHVMNELLGAMARRSGLKMKIDFSKLHHMFMPSSHGGMNMQLNQSSIITMTMVLLTGILAFFACNTSGKGSKLLIAEGTKQLIKKMSTTGLKTAFKGGAMMVGGVVGLAFALPEAVDSWKEAIKKNHVTEASQSQRDTANTILKMTRKLREEFDHMRKMLEDIAEQQEQERIEKARRQQVSWLFWLFVCFCLLYCILQFTNLMSSESGDRNLPSITTFEYVDTVLQPDTWNEPILFINVYSPRNNKTRPAYEEFLEEFQSLLDHFSNYSNIVVAGDFNIQVDTAKFIPSRFREFLRNNSLVQHVNEVTHKKNHTLDLVMSRNVDVSDLSVQNDHISDHYTISVKAKPKDQEGKAVKVGLLNCRSVNKKPEKICHLIERNNLDIFLLTETWSRDNTADKVLSEASPEGFSFRYKSRKNRRGGGVAIMFRTELLKHSKKMKSKIDQDESAKRFKENEE